MDHHELVMEMTSIERMATQDRLKHARKRRSQQLKKWGQYEKQLEKDSSKKKKKQEPQLQTASQRKKNKKSERVRFIANIALLESAARNDLDEVKRLLQNNVSPDVTNEDGLTALHQCCIDDNEEMLKLLLEYGANVNACDSELWTPLHASATCGHVTLCKHLIDRGAELLSVNADGNMPYDICEDEITLDYIETEMAKRGITQDQIDETRLTTERIMLNDLKSYASKGGDLEFKDNSGASMLHIAAANGYLDVAEFLLDHHVTVDCRDPESWQPIHAAAYWGQMEVLELLVHNGADLDSKTKNGETSFDLCEDPDIKQRILDMKDEIETNKASRLWRGNSSRKHKANSRNASIRRTSIRGEKSNLFKKEAHEEALHFGLRHMHDEEELTEMDEEKENLPATNIDDVTISFEDLDNQKPADVPSAPSLSTSSPSRTDNHKHSRSDENSVQKPSALSQGNGPKETALLDSNSFVPPAPVPLQRGVSNQGRAPPPGAAGSTLNDLKKHRSDSNRSDSKEISDRDLKKEAEDAQFESMFLDSVPNNGRRTGNSSSSPQTQPQIQIYPPPMMDRTKNGHNNNTTKNPASVGTTSNSNSANSSFSFREGQLRRFVAPPNAPVVGGENEDKQHCCVIL